MNKNLKDFSTLVSLCKRRGFIFQSSEIYGGINSCWDFGPLGVELKNNLKRVWWNAMTRSEDIVGLDASILMAPQVWKASGHIDGFSDPLVECKKCRSRFREDNIQEPGKCNNCKGELSAPKQFNLMFKTFMGPVEETASIVYLRPETAQGIYVNFENVQTSMRKKIPFGIAQIGKAFRNEITPGNFIFRTREFEQMEMQYFVKPGTDEKFMEQWKEIRMNFYTRELGIKRENLEFHQHGPKELAHYAKSAFDIQYEFPIGWQEIEGIHNRSDFDLGNHQKLSGKSLLYFDEQTKEKFLPFVIETSAGCDRNCLTLLTDAYREEKVAAAEGEAEGEGRVVLGFHPDIAPIKAAILPLSKKENLVEISKRLFKELSKEWMVQYDDTASIGKRYRRQDEIGTPLCITVDFQSLEDQQVTIRHRDSMKQDRISMSQLKDYVREKLNAY
jgi:glycyl-tRNA synthetase